MITSIRWKKIAATCTNTIKGPTEASNNLKILGIKEHALKSLTEKQKLAEVDFMFTVKYAPELATLEFEGTAIYINAKEKVIKLIKKWDKEKKIDQECVTPIFNNLLARCTTKALMMEEELGLPFHIPLPKITPKTPTILPKAS